MKSSKPSAYNARFPVTHDMSPISYIVREYRYETKEENALWHYNKSREHDGLEPLKNLPRKVKFEPIWD
jgi:hypothetical protein